MRHSFLKSLSKLGTLIGAMTAVAATYAADATQPAAAPAATEAPIEEVVVMGFRTSLEKAISIKREESSQVDAILAEDIGKFPDQNLAESLQRVPGVTITREGGEGRQITVRGLGPQYTRTRINGMEALTTVGSPDNNGGVNRSRSFDFNVFAPDLFTKIEVHKTAEGQLDEGSLGATVDLYSAHPLDFERNTVIVSAKGDYNDQSKTKTPRAGIMLSTKNEANTLGVLFSIAASHRDISNVGFSTVRWDEGNVLSTGTVGGVSTFGFGNVLGTNCLVNPLPAPCATADAALHPRFPRYDIFRERVDRLGGSLSLQYKPNDEHLMNVDYLYSRWQEKRDEAYLEAPGFSGSGACPTPSTCTSIANISILSENINNGVLSSGTFNGVDARTEARYDELHTVFNQLTLNSVDHWTDKLWTDTLLGANTSRFENPIQTTIGWDLYNVQGFSYAFSGTDVPVLNFGNANVNSPGAWVLTGVRERPQTTSNDFRTLAETLHFDMWDQLKFSGGASYKEFKYSTTSLRLVNGESVTATNAYSSLRSTPLSSYGVGKDVQTAGIGAPGGSTTQWFAPSVALAANALGLYGTSLFGLSPLGDLGNNAGITEKDVGAFLQADFSVPIGDRTVRGNAGMRNVTTRQSSNGYNFVNGVLTAVTSEHTYSEFLPSLNFALDVTPDVVVRTSAARVMTRPDLGSLVGTTTVSVSGTQFGVTTGNPNLKPFLANSYDLAVEWYPAKGTTVSLAAFQKDIVTLVAKNVMNIPFIGNPFGIPTSAAVAACGSTPGCSPSATWAFNAPTNTSGGTVKGAELNYQQPFTFLGGFWSHFGLLANVTLVNSKVNYPNGTGGLVQNQLLGLSKKAANATLYYEDEKWSIRVSEAYRGPYLIAVPGGEVGTDADGFLATRNVDLSVQYTVNEHLKLSFEGINLTNAQEQEFNDTSLQLPYYVHQTGREYLLGFRYEL